MVWNTSRCCATSSCDYLSLHLWCQKKDISKKEDGRIRRADMRYSMMDWTHLGMIFGFQIAGCWVTPELPLLNKSSWVALHVSVWNTLAVQQWNEKSIALQNLKKNILKFYIFVLIKIHIEITLTKFCCLSLNQETLLTCRRNYIKYLQKINFTVNKTPY